MATLRNPALFSQRYGVDPNRLAKLGIFDPTLNADTKLFIDPLLLGHSQQVEFRKDAKSSFESHFNKIIKLLQHSKTPGDLTWRNAEGLFRFKEPRWTCLGYGDRTTHGSAIGPTLRARLMHTAKEIIDLGVTDPELFALLGLLEEGIGADRISDMTTHAILPALLRFNEKALPQLGLPTEEFHYGDTDFKLVRNPYEKGHRSPVILVPTDILRELPIAHDWSDVAHAASQNEGLRRKVNERIGNIWAVQTKKDKEKARRAAMQSKEAFETLMSAVGLCEKRPYDAKGDPEGHYLWRKVVTEIAKKFPIYIAAPKAKTADELEKVVDQIINAFIDLVENKGQWYHLWQNGTPRHERAAQRLFFAVAESYCKANNLDINPETDSGGGSVDFKFSSGYIARVIVELKKSDGKVVSGYQNQLEVYKKAESTTRAKYLVVDVGGMGSKLQRILTMKNQRTRTGERASDIIVVDGTRKVSASKRS